MANLAAPMRQLFSLLFILVTLSGCKKEFTGSPKENLPPETHTVVDTIIRSGPDRLESLVTLQWWGDDPDGVVKGYEFTFDSIITSATVWHFTTYNDSTFTLQIPIGQDSVDFVFHIRAIDNNGLVDPTPARLGVPVKNSTPTIVFVDGFYKPLRTFPVIKFYWSANDPDGIENLSHVEAVWNDTTQAPFTLDVIAQSATFEATNPSADQTDVNVYINNALTSIGTMQGLLLNDTNKLFIRAVDKSLSHSAYVSSYTIYVKKVSSPVLLVDGYGNSGAAATAFYGTNLQAIGITQFDTLPIFKTLNGEFTQQSPDNLTQARIFKLFNTIVWFSNDATKSLSLGQKTLGQFFDNNGKLFMATYVAGSFDQQSTFLDFTPAQALATLPTDTVLTMNTGANVNALQTGWPDSLKSTSIIGTVRPFIPALGATALYDAELIAQNTSNSGTSSWNGVSTVIAKKNGSNGQPNFIFCVMELQKLNGLNNMPALFDKIFHGEFGL